MMHNAFMKSTSIVAGSVLILLHFGSSAVSRPWCAPSRNAQLQPRWLHGAFELAGIEADAHAHQSENENLLSWIREQWNPRDLKASTAFLIARGVLQCLCLVVVFMGALNGARIISKRLAIYLKTGVIGTIIAAAAASVVIIDSEAPFVSTLTAVLVWVVAVTVLCAICSLPILVGVADAILRVFGVSAQRRLILLSDAPPVPSEMASHAKTHPVSVGIPVVLGLQPSSLVHACAGCGRACGRVITGTMHAG